MQMRILSSAGLKKGQQLISAIQLQTRDKDYFNELIKKDITSVAIEHIMDKEGKLPILRSMGEIAGNTSILIASEYLSNVNLEDVPILMNQNVK